MDTLLTLSLIAFLMAVMSTMVFGICMYRGILQGSRIEILDDGMASAFLWHYLGINPHHVRGQLKPVSDNWPADHNLGVLLTLSGNTNGLFALSRKVRRFLHDSIGAAGEKTPFGQDIPISQFLREYLGITDPYFKMDDDKHGMYTIRWVHNQGSALCLCQARCPETYIENLEQIARLVKESTLAPLEAR